MDNQEIKTLIEKRRRQIIIHSCIYYVYGKALITDTQFDRWAYELVDLQREYPNIGGDWAFEFHGFDGTTGFHLNLYNEWVMGKAQILIEYAEKNELFL